MNHSKLREWLKMPPGAWPPGDRELLGFLADDKFDANTVEIRALERMDLLRPRQLVEPELVTEGMNRLAQAMVALSTSSATRPAEVVKKPKKPVREKTPVEIRKPAEVNLDFGAPNPTTIPSLPTIPAVLEAEVVELADDANQVIPESVAVLAEDRVTDVLLEPIVIPEPPPGTVIVPSPRRDGYRTLARLRRVHAFWMKFRPILGDPSESLDTPTRIATYLTTRAELRAELSKPIGLGYTFPDEGGELVCRIVFHPLPMALLRDLGPAQRVAVARDWAIGEADLRAKLARLRNSMNQQRHKRLAGNILRSIFRWTSSNPEWLLLVLTIAMLIVGWMRRIPK